MADTKPMRGPLAILLSLALLGVGFATGNPASAADFDVKRPSVSKKRTQRTGPTLPSELEPKRVEREPSASEEAWEEYYREQAEYYREKRRERQPSRSTAGSCMYGADGKVIYAPPGRSCGGPAAPSQ
jgi:hypothetical protein